MGTLIIKGAIYRDGNVLLRPQYTGVFSSVQCTEFKTKEEIEERYSENLANRFLENTCLTCDGVEYFQCEYNCYQTNDMVLLSDLSTLDFFDEETEF